MDITDVNQTTFVDLFATDKQDDTKGPLRFGSSSDQPDLFADKPDPAITPDPSTTPDPAIVAPADIDPAKVADPNNPDADILGQPKPGRKPKYDFTDMTGYFEDRIKNGKFVAIEEQAEDGSKKNFVPKTPEEFDEVIELQVNWKLDQERKGLDQKWYQTKSPAWQAVAKYAELTDDPTEILPFLTGVKTIDSVSEIDPKTIEGAEKIIRTRMQQKGDTDDIINEQVEALKTTDKLISTAEKFKPVIIQQEQQRLAQMVNERKQEEQEYNSLVHNIRQNAIKAIEAPFIGNTKLKQEEKAAIYELIAEPSQETKGYPIYSAIDSLFEKGDFETLKKIALLISKQDSFLGYVSESAANKTAVSLQKKLRVAADGRTTSGNDDPSNNDRQTIQRNQFTPGQARFGR